MVTQLEIEGHAPGPELDWLRRSWVTPHAFFHDLLAYSSAWIPTPAKSVAFVNYDFYHDIVLRHTVGGQAGGKVVQLAEGAGHRRRPLLETDPDGLGNPDALPRLQAAQHGGECRVDRARC